jgi:hypothetical protein
MASQVKVNLDDMANPVKVNMASPDDMVNTTVVNHIQYNRAIRLILWQINMESR